MNAYIGKKLRLISKSDIRYEGVVYSLDATDSSLTLTQVRSFGTEGRREVGPQIPASSEVYASIIFSGKDIKQVDVIDGATAAPQAPPQKAPMQQAPPPQQYMQPPPQQQAPPPQYQQLQYQQPPPQQAPPAQPVNPWNRAPAAAPVPQQRQQRQQAAPKAKPAAAPAPAPAAPKPKPTSFLAAVGGGGGGAQPKGQPARVAQPAGGRGGAPAPRAGGRGGAMPAPRAGGRGGPPPFSGGDGLLPTRMAVPTGDFNFEAAFSKFSKEDFANQQAAPVSTYVKDDFFDSMSCEALERAAVAAQPQGRSRFHEQRKLDMDTFGAAGGVRRVEHGGRGGRGDGGRGGRGDGGRGGRGGRTVSHGYQNTGRGGRGGGRGRGRN